MLRIKLIPILFLVLLSWRITYANSNDLKDRLREHVKILASDSLQGRGLGTSGAEKARDYIVGQFRDAGIQPLADDYLQNFSFRQSLAWIPAVNIVGMVEGNDSELKDEFILIGAHYDHLGYDIRNDEKRIFPGADDNASGVAAIIELGRYFAQNPELLGRSLIIVAFDAEESGLIGSRHFVDNSPVPIENIKLMFSFDMVGMYEANRGLHLRGMASLLGGDALAAEVARRHEINLRQFGENIERRTDTQPFGNAGIPAVHVYTGQKSPYHKPEDQYHLLDYDGMVTIHIFMEDFLKVLSHESELRQSPSLIASVLQERTFGGRRPAAGFLLNTGTGFHRYPDEFFQAKTLFNISTGLYFQIPLSQVFGLQLEALYDLNGSQIDGGNFRRHSITVPLNIQFGTPGVQGEDIRLFMFTGPYYRRAFAGESAGVSLDFDNVFNRDEWGYTIGLGLNVFRIYMGYTSRRAVTNLLQSDEMKILDSNGYFSIGYRF
jgi:aminopeptidase YwaD